MSEGAPAPATATAHSREGTLRERWLVGGVVSDDAAYGLLARDVEG